MRDRHASSATRASRLRPTAIGIFAAGVLALLLKPSGAAGSVQGAVFAGLVSAALVALVLIPFALRVLPASRQLWYGVAAAGLAAGVTSAAVAARVQGECIAHYGGRPVIAGTDYTADGEAYRRANPHLSRDEQLFDARGVAEDVWTRESIARCRSLLRGTHFLWIPCLSICLVALAQALRARSTSLAAPAAVTPAAAPAPAECRYDVFLSYRHGGRDSAVAHQIREVLEADGYRVAIDQRDFAANGSFLEEMERCIRESRFTVAVVSARYLESGNCQEEAIVCKVLDMGERRRRLIPFLIEPVPMPAWMYGIVGISSFETQPLVDPVEKLEGTLGPPLGTVVAS